VPTPILSIPEVAPTQTDKTTTINDAIVALEAATQDQLSVNMSGGDLSLTSLQFTRYAFFLITGQTAARTLTVPLSKRLFGVRNAGSYTITVKGLSGSSVAVAAGDGAIIQNDGSNCIVFGSGGVGPAGPTGAAGAISSLTAGIGLTGGTIITSGETITADWQVGLVTALGSNLSLIGDTLQSHNVGALLVQWVLGTIVDNGVFYFAYKAPYAGTVNSLDCVSGSGTFGLGVAINGTAVTSLSAVSVGSAAHITATAANTFSAGDTISGTISSASGSPTDAVLSLNVTWL
jgi:hypothetical protein